MFKWSVTKELVDVLVWQRLTAIDGLKEGRSKAPDRPPIQPVDDETFERVREFMPDETAAMARIQRLAHAGAERAEEGLGIYGAKLFLTSADRSENYQQHYVGPGVHFLITPDIEIDTRVFWGIGEDSAEFTCPSGAGVRF